MITVIKSHYLCCDNNEIAYKQLENGMYTTICLTCNTDLGTTEHPLVESYITKENK
jgi:hypothetical protein